MATKKKKPDTPRKPPAWLIKSISNVDAPTSGWTEAQYAEQGLGSIKLRLPMETLEQLAQLAEDAKVSRSDVIKKLIAIQHFKVFMHEVHHREGKEK